MKKTYSIGAAVALALSGATPLQLTTRQQLFLMRLSLSNEQTWLKQLMVLDSVLNRHEILIL